MQTHQWDFTELTAFAQANDLQVSPFYSDGKTYGTPTWIWSVVVEQSLYIRAWNGCQSRWYRSAIRQGAGRIFLAGDNHEVCFEPVRGRLKNRAIDQAYRVKYATSPYLRTMLQAGPRRSTLSVTPRLEK
ncbi:DUF2255 family protein [Levilactobacillus spicheri]|uniref:DUF2255 family protein n=1 Tax=Levilactobacillus spicheri TaxID=216463 RepID=UPI003B8A8D42